MLSMITIIGCDHIHQRKGQRCYGDERLVGFEADQKRRFNETIAQEQEQRSVTLICEEIEQGCDTFARDLAHRRGRYANVDMPVEERERRGIPQGYSVPGALYTPMQVDEWHCEREQFMVERLMAEQQDKNEATLFICGRLHGDRLAAILRTGGLDAEVIDLADQEWFSDDWENDYPFP
jgi:hypothetical protein